MSDAQVRMLEQIESTTDKGYLAANKNEARTIEKLQEYKLVKRGSKDKESGVYFVLTSAAGKKFLAELVAKA